MKEVLRSVEFDLKSCSYFTTSESPKRHSKIVHLPQKLSTGLVLWHLFLRPNLELLSHLSIMLSDLSLSKIS